MNPTLALTLTTLTASAITYIVTKYAIYDRYLKNEVIVNFAGIAVLGIVLFVCAFFKQNKHCLIIGVIIILPMLVCLILELSKYIKQLKRDNERFKNFERDLILVCTLIGALFAVLQYLATI